MRQPRHAAEDGSFGRSAGMAAGRGAALLAVAVILGIVLLNAADDPPPDRVSAGSSDDDPSATSSTLPPSTVLTVPVRPPQEVRVLAANGTAVKGAAGRATDRLQAAGYNVLAPTDARGATSTNVFFTAGDFDREAQAVASALGLPDTVVAPFPTAPPLPVPDGRGANIIVVVGPELAEQLVAGTTTATTAAGASSTTVP